MKTTKKTFIAVTAIFIAACGSSKKSSTSISNTSTNPLVVTKPSNGVYAPGNEELTAIQVKYKDVTLEKLKEGHLIYTEGACMNCHGAKNIYRHDEAQWKDIIDDMAKKARISDEQKDAVYKYVLAIKATQVKGN